jgi:hypothetical protein
MGRILSIFGKDIDSQYLTDLYYAMLAETFHPGIDNQLPRESSVTTWWDVTYTWSRINKIAYVSRTLRLRRLTQDPVVITLSSVMGSIIIVSVLEPYFGQYIEIICEDLAHACLVIAVFFIALGYSYFAAFYRAGAREVKRLGLLLYF